MSNRGKTTKTIEDRRPSIIVGRAPQLKLVSSVQVRAGRLHRACYRHDNSLTIREGSLQTAVLQREQELIVLFLNSLCISKEKSRRNWHISAAAVPTSRALWMTEVSKDTAIGG